VVPIGSDSTAFTARMQADLSSKYGSNIRVETDTTSASLADFDYNFLFPRKLEQESLKGGIFFKSTAATRDGNTFYHYSTLVNTRSPTSPFLLENLATEAILKEMLGKSVSIGMTNSPMPRTYQ
jgi:hypothetical protein